MTIDSAVLAESLQRLHLNGSLVVDVDAVLAEAVTAPVQVFGVTGCGLLLVDEHSALRYIASSDEPGRVLEVAQTTTGEGPCVDTFVYDRPVGVADLADDPRWPRCTPLILPYGVRAVLGVPVRLGGGPVGSLNLYYDRHHDWNEDEVSALRRYGELIEVTLAAALTAERASKVAEQLQYALDYRVVIERAVGFLMARDGGDAVAAFNVLRNTARSSRRKVGDVAAELLGTPRSDPLPPPAR